jgi:carbonic anhydrase
MNADWAIAEAGIRQSPIDIIPERTLTLPTLKPIEFHYSGGLHLLMDNGHTIQVDIKNDENYIVINGQKYELLQFHFHAKSEHTLNGHAAKMEVHLVHKLVTEAPHGDSCVPAPDGHTENPKAPQVQLAVVGVMIEPGSEAHPFIKDLWSDLNAVKPNDGGIRFRLDAPLSLVPPKGKRSYYRYNGSLTTPPCSENVLWTVMSEPIHFSAAQIKAFTDRYSNNARPVMKKARRFVLKYEDKPTDFTPAVLVPRPAPRLLPNTIPVPLTNAPSIGVRGGIDLPKLPTTPGTVPAPQPR